MNATVPPPDSRLSLRWLLDRLVEQGEVTLREAREAWVRQSQPRTEPRHPLLLVADCALPQAKRPGQVWTLDALGEWLAAQAGLTWIRIDPLSLDLKSVTGLIPHAYAARAQILPIRLTPETLVVATAEPWWTEWLRDVQPVVGRRIERVLANPADIERYLNEFHAVARSVKGAEALRRERGPTGQLQNLEQLVALSRSGKLDAEAQPVVAIVDWLLQYAFESRASDIHLEPRREQAVVRFRIDGVLHEVYQVPASVVPAITSRLKLLARLDLAEKRRPQDGRIKTRSPDGRDIELRVASLPTAFGEKLVLRIFDPGVLLKDFAALGFSATEEALWRRLVGAPHGIVLVTGPTGSGKTTTLYATLRALARPEVNVCTIEDPIELIEPAFNQMQVNPAIGLGFADGVRALLRQDPDIIMIGEIRDRDTAEVAIQAALTGHLVLATLHTNDAPGAIARLLDLGAPPYLLRATLLGVLAQRLVRALCPACKTPEVVDADRWAALGTSVALPETVFAPAGCPQCRQTGYHGRLGVYELLRITPRLRQAITAEADGPGLYALAEAEGMTALRDAAARAVADGRTALPEALSVLPPTFT